jgi:hypothetical protein
VDACVDGCVDGCMRARVNGLHACARARAF